jgi:hypothetical protein
MIRSDRGKLIRQRAGNKGGDGKSAGRDEWYFFTGHFPSSS